jgi:hypothetical protein
MWDWRQMTSGAGYKEAPRSFRINPDNYSGKRLYRLVGRDADLLVTNACRELCGSANHHGTPDPAWLRENLELLAPFDVLLVCGKVAQATYVRSGHEFEHKIDIPHPAARMWTQAMIAATAEQVKALAAGRLTETLDTLPTANH